MQEYILWGGIFLAGLIVFGITIVILLIKLSMLSLFVKLLGPSRRKRVVSAAILMMLVFGISACFLRVINSAVILLHIMVFWLIIDAVLILFIKNKSRRINISFVSALLLAGIYLMLSFYWCFSVKPKTYHLTSDKNIGNLKVLFFADSHLGTTISGEELYKYIEMINSEKPDVVLIPGDFVDDGTSLEDMLEGCKALSAIESYYGVYYVFGNHDKGYSDVFSRSFTGDDLTKELEANGVVVLQDEVVLIDDLFYIVGRQDKSEESRGQGRESIAELTLNLDDSRYIIVMDHQPNDYEAEANTPSDLVLSGHTHGGQLMPFLDVGVWLGVNDAVYGYERREDTDFIVTSGISDWELYFKSGCKSEYVIVEINGL